MIQWANARRDWGSGAKPDTPRPRTGENSYTFANWCIGSRADRRTVNEVDHRSERQAAKHLLSRDERRIPQLRWHVAGIVAACWISSAWSAEEALTEIAQQSYYGHGFGGIHAASAGYFGKPVAELAPAQIAALVVIAEAPTRLSPWCNPSALSQRAADLEKRIGEFTPNQLLEDLSPTPQGACS